MLDAEARPRLDLGKSRFSLHWLALAAIRDMVAGGVARGHERQDRCVRRARVSRRGRQTSLPDSPMLC